MHRWLQFNFTFIAGGLSQSLNPINELILLFVVYASMYRMMLDGEISPGK